MNADTDKDDIHLEDALAELEDITRKIEQGDQSLDESLALFERGIALTRLCSSKLETARQKIEKLVDENKTEEMELE
ncbi:MAG: exodeoxyribonuclease VII small subunit [ANME-2 cluster archaeon]|nr:exodeoxyribonuclease VII small subunit [ANME-2 cluster archaeon]MCL7476215.1 exodeoxyribonuclease VII small subunit [ANME-2 cluster archaeon]MDW7775231.1 exodeoxyribonuclease VII small subunit [Methanosarcinales archaeon]